MVGVTSPMSNTALSRGSASIPETDETREARKGDIAALEVSGEVRKGLTQRLGG